VHIKIVERKVGKRLYGFPLKTNIRDIIYGCAAV